MGFLNRDFWFFGVCLKVSLWSTKSNVLFTTITCACKDWKAYNGLSMVMFWKSGPYNVQKKLVCQRDVQKELAGQRDKARIIRR